MITLTKGLNISLIILEILRNDAELRDIEIYVGAFTNGREVGLTFAPMGLYSEKKERQYNCVDSFTWCIYEHRNSDNIIINGKEGFISLSGDLPYKADNKYDYLKEFDYNQYYEAAEWLKKSIIEWCNIHKR